jgi:hypothetical protein
MGEADYGKRGVPPSGRSADGLTNILNSADLRGSPADPAVPTRRCASARRTFRVAPIVAIRTSQQRPFDEPVQASAFAG